MKVIQVLIVFLLLGLSTSVLAKGDREQVLITPPLWGEPFAVMSIAILNKSVGDISVSHQIINGHGQIKDLGSSTIFPGRVLESESTSLTGVGYFKVYWYGQSDDLIVTVCVEVLATGSRSCVNAN